MLAGHVERGAEAGIDAGVRLRGGGDGLAVDRQRFSGAALRHEAMREPAQRVGVLGLLLQCRAEDLLRVGGAAGLEQREAELDRDGAVLRLELGGAEVELRRHVEIALGVGGVGQTHRRAAGVDLLHIDLRCLVRNDIGLLAPAAGAQRERADRGRQHLREARIFPHGSPLQALSPDP